VTDRRVSKGEGEWGGGSATPPQLQLNTEEAGRGSGCRQGGRKADRYTTKQIISKAAAVARIRTRAVIGILSHPVYYQYGPSSLDTGQPA